MKTGCLSGGSAGSRRLRQKLGDAEGDVVLFSSGLDLGPALDRNLAALVPALDCGVIGVVELSRHFPNAAKAIDDFPMGFHAAVVRCGRTYVNDENVPPLSDKVAMSTVGEKLMLLRERSGLTLDQVAKRMGLKGRSSVQRLFAGDVDMLGPVDALRLADVLEGLGTPPITREGRANQTARTAQRILRRA
jgi:hypothetical protein